MSGPVTEEGENVGYKRPPRRGQFAKGRSGNPRGRPRGSSNLATVLDRSNAERVTFSENGRRRTISKLEATIKQIVNRAALGDPKATQMQIALTQWAEGREEGIPAAVDPFTEQDREVIEAISARLKRLAHEGRDG